MLEYLALGGAAAILASPLVIAWRAVQADAPEKPTAAQKTGLQTDSQSGAKQTTPRRNWLDPEYQGPLLARQAAAAGIALADQPPKRHAEELNRWCQCAVGAGEKPTEMRYADICEIYAEMCLALSWRMLSWNSVGRHFAKLTGGRTYVSVWNPKTKRNNGRERAYIICQPARSTVPGTMEAADEVQSMAA